jgi:flagellar M-ring protein FliF
VNDFFKKLKGHITELWGKWSPIQKVIFSVIVIAAIGGIFALLSVSSSPSLTPVIDAPIRDQAVLDRIIMRINEEGVSASANAAGIVQVADVATARRMRAILIREDLIPTNADPWNIFDKERWTITDFERNVNFQRAQRQMIIDHIKAIDDIDDANVVFVVPERRLLGSEQDPVTASVSIIPKPGSDITRNIKKIEGIQKLLKFSIPGLQDDNIVITDQAGNILNDFTGMAAANRLILIAQEHKHIQTLEKKYRDDILRALQHTFSSERVRDLNIKFDLDMSKVEKETEEFGPIIMKPPTPGLPYDDSIRRESITRSSSRSTTTWTGTGFNPEGPSGTEGQTAPAMKDMSNIMGHMEQETNVTNEELNRQVTKEERSPEIKRVTVAVNIDGTWKRKYDEKGKLMVNHDGTIDREYTPVPAEKLRDATLLVQDAIGFSAERGDSVTVANIEFDRTVDFAEEDAAYFRKKQMQTTIIIFLAGLTLLMISFIIFRVVAREMERRRRLAEEERARREQALRESAMMEAEQEGMEVSISMEERARMELMESVVNLTKDHPEDCAQLIRTWLLEE